MLTVCPQSPRTHAPGTTNYSKNNRHCNIQSYLHVHCIFNVLLEHSWSHSCFFVLSLVKEALESL